MTGETEQTPVTMLLRTEELQVRPITLEEESLWNDLMGRYHYLGYQRIVGESMRYAAILEGEWVGLLGWGAAAFKSRHRDKWIGWAAALQYKRLKFVANNVRFLLLPEKPIKNLASRILTRLSVISPVEPLLSRIKV
jgi:hypothetical protein